MTITYERGEVSVERDFKIKKFVKVGPHSYSEGTHQKMETRVKLTPGRTSFDDTVIIFGNNEAIKWSPSGRTLKGEAIKKDPECQGLGISWFSQERVAEDAREYK